MLMKCLKSGESETRSYSSDQSTSGQDIIAPVGRNDILAFLKRQFGKKANSPSTESERRVLKKMLDDLNTAEARLWSRYLCDEHANGREVDLFKQGLSMGKPFGEHGPMENLMNGFNQLTSAIVVLQTHVTKKIDSLSKLFTSTAPKQVSSPKTSTNPSLPVPLSRPGVVQQSIRKSQALSEKTKEIISKKVHGREDQVYILIDSGMNTKDALIKVL